MKLPVFRTVGEAYAFVWRERNWMVWLGVAGGAVVAGGFWLAIGAPTSSGGLQEMSNDFPWSYLVVAILLLVVVYSAIFILYSVAWHRRYLLPDERISLTECWRWHGRHTRFIFDYLKVTLAFVVVGSLTMVAWQVIALGVVAGAGVFGFPLMVGAPFAAMLFLGWLFARMSMLFPATAVDEHMDFMAGWEFTRGHGWRLLAIIIVVAIPAAVALWIVEWVVEINQVADEIALWSVALVLFAAQLFVTLAGFAAGITALSIAYRHLREWPVAAENAT